MARRRRGRGDDVGRRPEVALELAVAFALGELVATLLMAIVVAVFPPARAPAPCRVTDPVTYEIRRCDTFPDHGVPPMPSTADAAE